MKNNEVYIWNSLVATSVLFIGYLIYVFGWPNILQDYKFFLTGMFWNVLAITILLELGFEFMKSRNTNKDNEDITANLPNNGYKNAYHFLMGGLLVVIGHYYIYSYFGWINGGDTGLAIPVYSIHILVSVFFISNIIKSASQLVSITK